MSGHQVVELFLNVVFWGLVVLLIPRRTRKPAAITLVATIAAFFVFVGTIAMFHGSVSSN